MKKNIRRITILLITAILVFTIFYAKPIQAVTTTLKASSAKVKSGEEFSITVSSSIKLSGWTISLSNNGGCTFSSASGGTVNGTSVYGTSLDGTTSLATYTFKAPTVTKDTTYTISFSGSGMCDATDGANIVDDASCKATVTVQAKQTTPSGNTGSSGNSGSNGSSGSSGNSGTTTTKPKEPTFKSANKTVYTTGDVNLRSSWSTSSSATTVAKGTELKLTGTSTETINGYIWYRVTYKGATKYVAKSLITETKPKDENEDDEKPQQTDKKSSNKSLSSLSIEGIELTPKFDKETTTYTAKVDGDVTELKINTKAEDSKAKVAVEGNKDLKEGDNVIKVKVTAEDDTTRTYFITVTKGEGTQADTGLKLSELKIARVDFENSFKPDTYRYELTLNTYVENLDITAVANKADAKVEITGNSNFKVGKNMVVILLTSADGTQTATYQIEVNVQEEAVAKTEETSTEMYIMMGVAIAIVIIIFGIIITHFRANKSKGLEEDDEDFESDEQEKVEANKEYNEEFSTSKRKKSDVTLDDFINASEDEQEKPKKSKGRHSM